MSYISWASDFASYLWLYLIDRQYTLGSCSVSHCNRRHIFCLSLRPVFHGPVILPCISDGMKKEGIIHWILVQSDTVSDLIIFVGHCDLYFMVQRFCLISLALSYSYAS